MLGLFLTLNAITFAVKNSLALTTSLFAVGLAVTSIDLTIPDSPRLVAVAFALAGVLWRWYKFRLSFRSATSEMFISSLFAFLLGDTQILGTETFFSNLRPESLPMLNGLLIGVFNVAIVSGVADFIKIYTARKNSS